MKDLGVLNYFLGLEVVRNEEGLFVYQQKYALDIIVETGLLGAKPSGFPIEQNHTLTLANVHILAQFMQHPRQEHWDAPLRVVRYLKGCPRQGILLRSYSTFVVIGWCDSDWASCPLTHRSLMGWIVFLGGSPVSWKTKKQHIVSRSSTEAEYRSMAQVVAEMKWLTSLLRDLGVTCEGSMPFLCDSQSALHIVQNPVFHEPTKHIEVDCHYVRDTIHDGTISTTHVFIEDQLADIFIKVLGKRQFLYLLHKLGICDIHAPT
ncbi:transmembrane signal receptor [Lithospermum erythrorhizon]|uniref:Transmembrane signal receptor n=1 Tax=Lithospermum erythrorhizon TaxID=34254 RepID=A0AAV3Q3T6_LITER